METILSAGRPKRKTALDSSLGTRLDEVTLQPFYDFACKYGVSKSSLLDQLRPGNDTWTNHNVLNKELETYVFMEKERKQGG